MAQARAEELHMLADELELLADVMQVKRRLKARKALKARQEKVNISLFHIFPKHISIICQGFCH